MDNHEDISESAGELYDNGEQLLNDEVIFAIRYGVAVGEFIDALGYDEDHPAWNSVCVGDLANTFLAGLMDLTDSAIDTLTEYDEEEENEYETVFILEFEDEEIGDDEDEDE